MKTCKQDIHDLLSQLAADIEEIKALLNSAAAGTGAAGKNNAISNDVTDGNRAAFTAGNGGVLTSNPDALLQR